MCLSGDRSRSLPQLRAPQCSPWGSPFLPVLPSLGDAGFADHSEFPGTAGCSWPTLTGGLWHFWGSGFLVRPLLQTARRNRRRVSVLGCQIESLQGPSEPCAKGALQSDCTADRGYNLRRDDELTLALDVVSRRAVRGRWGWKAMGRTRGAEAIWYWWRPRPSPRRLHSGRDRARW
jgi:hypothetical protein